MTKTEGGICLCVWCQEETNNELIPGYLFAPTTTTIKTVNFPPINLRILCPFTSRSYEKQKDQS